MFKDVIDNDYEALVQALALSLTAQTDEQMERVTPMLHDFAAKFDEVTVERAKKEALAITFLNAPTTKGE